MPNPVRFGILLLLPSSLAALQANEGERARALFVANCASCHGERGDGQGTTQLDRPARSFQDGGFSFGNTPEALFKTISVGIPGSPMAGFDSSLSEEERRLVAAYVVTLGPPIEAVKEEDMLLEVHDKPLVVRGLLPSLGEGLPTHPRGLLIGDPSGITFEYRVDDVRLLALRQGGFVRRSDWTGRGGTALEPLGKVVQLVEAGRPGELFSLGLGTVRLDTRLAGTTIEAGHVVIDYHLLDGAHEVAHVSETPLVVTRKSGTGYARRFLLTGARNSVHVALKDASQPGAEDLFQEKLRPASVHAAAWDRRASEFLELELRAQRFSRRGGWLVVDLERGETAELTLSWMPAAAWGETATSISQHDR